MIRCPKAAAFLILITVTALGLAALFLVASKSPAQAQTQTPAFKIETFHSGLPEVYEGAEVLFQVTRTVAGIPASDVTVEVETWEPNLDDGNGNNPSLQTHQDHVPCIRISRPRT